MKVLYVDCFSGVSGDMMLGALIDLGINVDEFQKELQKLKISGYELIIGTTLKSGIKGTDVDVVLFDGDRNPAGNNEKDIHQHESRNLKNIEELIDMSDLKTSVKNLSKKIFREIANAEAKVHGEKLEEIHFHEVGAVDSIIDIVGTSICLDMLGVGRTYSSALHDGYGFIECQHGIIPVPVPAVMEMLKNTNIPVISENVNTELVTPTGLAILKSISISFGKMPLMSIENIGYGMGKRDTGRLNALRVVIGEMMEEDKLLDEVLILETNIDDSTPETISYALERLFEAGALDAFTTPVFMKKNRPGNLITVISTREHEHKLVDILFKETSTIGVRSRYQERHIMNRETISVKTKHGEVRVKISSVGNFKKLSPEYEDCRYIAKKTGMPLNEIYRMVEENSKKFL
ncbi:MAG: nickel pincer cofactor biosynthesis protein LarC [Clostridia bacterium]|jgi:hypothetical protein